MAYRIETGRLDKAAPAPGGGLRIPATIGRTGILEYRKADGSIWREYRSPEEAFAAESLASLRGAPVTDLHPSGAVTPETYATVARGHVGDDARQDEDGEHVAASLYANDARLIRGIESGARREVSAGYTTDLVLEPGTAPDGTTYDARQTNISYNHVAVGPQGWGRAGASVELRLDGDLNATDPAVDAGHDKGQKPMKMERIDGVDYEIGTDTWRQARERFDAAQAKRLGDLEAEVEAQKTRADTAEKERDEAKGRADGLQASAEAAADPTAIDAMVAARTDLIGKATTIKTDLKTDGLSDVEIMAGALEIETDDTPEGYIRGRFDAAVETTIKADGSRRAVRLVAGGGTDAPVSKAKAAQLRMVARNAGKE